MRTSQLHACDEGKKRSTRQQKQQQQQYYLLFFYNGQRSTSCPRTNYGPRGAAMYTSTNSLPRPLRLQSLKVRTQS